MSDTQAPFTMDRPIARLIEETGFRFETIETGYLPGPKVLDFNYWGAALPV